MIPLLRHLVSLKPIASQYRLRENAARGVTYGSKGSSDADRRNRGSAGRTGGGPLGLPHGAEGQPGIGSGTDGAGRGSRAIARYPDAAARSQYGRLSAGVSPIFSA